MSNDSQETHLDALVDKLYAEGIEKANAEAEKIVTKAREEAAEIVKKAKAEGEKITEEGKKKAQTFEANAVASVKQASRDVVLELENSIRELFSKSFKKQAADSLNDPEFLKQLIADLAKAWAGGEDVSVLVNEDVAEKIMAAAKDGVVKELGDGVEIKAGRTITNGFRIRRAGDAVAFDFTDESVVEILKTQVNPQLADILEL
ncbi:MAG: V-type ATP synthase subunit E family protein [Lentisphaeria bacterium]|nr:V-type ATP synthase subunit E family protein [Lentisphaeria bacterium]